MSDSLLSQGLTLMTYGMGTVFFFLALLVVVTNGISKIMARFFPEPIVEVPSAPKQSAEPSAGGPDASTIRIIQAAIAQHRKKNV